MAVTIEINAVEVERLKGSLQISEAIEQRSIASFTVVDRLGTGDYSHGQQVEIDIDGTLEFGGFINSITRKRVAPKSDILHHYITCMDYHYCADKRLVAASYVSKTAGFIVDDIYDNYLVPEGVGIGSIQAGADIEEMVINYESVSRTYDALAEQSNYIWYIDESKDLYFVPRDTTPAPFRVTTSEIIRNVGGGTSLKETSHSYRNRQYIRAGRDRTALQTETFTGDGDTKAFAVGYPIAQEPTIEVDAVGKTVGLKGLGIAKEFYWAKGDPIATAHTAPANATTIVIEYYGEFDIIVQVDDTPEQDTLKVMEGGGTGIVELIDDEPTLTSRQAALDVAVAKLGQHTILARQFVFVTDTYGLQPGQIVTIHYPTYGLNEAEMLIQSVDIIEFAPGELRYIIKALEGPVLGDWTGFFAALAGIKGDLVKRINVGSIQLLIVLFPTYEDWDWGESIDEVIFSCPVVALDLYPAADLYPC